jgi:pimeloyl-ACP methyl ester carboxylesterase
MGMRRPENPRSTGARPRPRWRAARIARLLLGLIIAPLRILLLLPISLLALVAETRSGRMAGVAAIALLSSAACAAVYRSSESRPAAWEAAAGSAFALAVVLIIVLLCSIPARRPHAAFGLRSHVVGKSRPARHTPADILPEIDQVRLAVTLGTRLVPWFGRGRGARIREVMTRLYREIHADPDARALPSLSYLTLAGLIFGDFDAGRYDVYLPQTEPDERLGAIVFLHGNGGNLKVLPWTWRSFANRHRFVIVCPTFGFGFWGAGGVSAVDRALSDALRHLPIDPDRVYLAGISDGGKGVTRSATAHPERYHGLIYVSPTMRQDELAAPAFVEAWRGRPILVVQGAEDRNVHKETVDPAVALLQAQGSDVTYQVFPNEDHFLFFARREEFFQVVQDWMASREQDR